ncbi:MAG: hypothetical protein JJU29_23550 [Verrucomicrobia bacterium]|nr:hypothetical protein [Verrucomicrobiota bacterium]
MSFQIDFEWIERQFGTELEKETFAKVKLLLDGHVLTEVYDRSVKNVRDHLAVSAWNLAEWFVANWWRLRWETEVDTPDADMSHRLPAVGGGYVWPDIRFSSDWNSVLVDVTPFEAKTAPLRFISRELHLAVPVQDFEKEMERFLSAVVSRVRESEAVRDERVQIFFSLWNELQEECRDETLSHWRKLEAIAGYDPGEAPDLFYQTIQDAEAKWGRNAVQELAAEGRDHTPRLIHEIQTLAKKRNQKLNVQGIQTLKLKRKSRLDIHVPWTRGHEAAQQVRIGWGLGENPLSSKDFADYLGLSKQFLSGKKVAPDTPIDFGIKKDGNVHCLIRGKWETSRRFALARLLGDCLYSDPEDQLLPLTKTKTARQKFQRAFAQELLCPLEVLKDMFSDRKILNERVEMAARHFNVSPMTIHSTLVNRLGHSRELLLNYEEID